MEKYSFIVWLLPFEDSVQVYTNGKLVTTDHISRYQWMQDMFDGLHVLGMCDRTEEPGVMYGFA